MLVVLFNLLEQGWFQTILGAISLGIAALITYGFALLQAWISTKIKNEKIRNFSNVAINLVRDSVLAVQQTFVDSLKKEGKFDKEMQAQAFEMAFKKVISGLTDEAKKTLADIHPDIEQWIKDQIEAMIKSIK